MNKLTISELDRIQSNPDTGLLCERNPKEHGRYGVRADGLLACGRCKLEVHVHAVPDSFLAIAAGLEKPDLSNDNPNASPSFSIR